MYFLEKQMNKEQELDNDMFRTNHILNAFVGTGDCK